MNSTRKYLPGRGAVLAAVLTVWLGSAASLRAQSSEIVPRLPVSTVGFVEWRGTNSLAGTAKNNHVIQLLSDPGMAPLWVGIAANVQKREENSKAPAPPLSLPEVVSLLENPAVSGVIELPRAADPPAGKTSARMAFFLVYDATGKTQLIEKWESATETRGPNAPSISHYNFSGTSVEIRSSGKGSSYLALAGNYFLVSDQKATIEQLITRFRSATAPADSVAQRPEYAEVKKFIGSDAAMDFFGRMPDVREWSSGNAKDQTGEKIIRNIHLEKVHAAGGSVSFAGPAMHMRGAILGNTLPTGPFDIAGTSGATFRTQTIASGAPEFSVSRVNFAAIYRLFYGAVVTNLPPQQAANVAALEAAAQGFLGMSIPDALDLFTGEVASSSSYSADGSEERVFAATIQKPDAVLHILRAVLGPMTLSEDSFGDATMLDIAYPYRDPATGLRRRTMYYVAVTPQMLLIAPRKALLRETLRQIAAPAGAGSSGSAKGVFAEAQYAQMRTLLPQKLSGLGVADFARIPWSAIFANFENRMEQASQRAAQQSKNANPPDFSWLKMVNSNVIPQHLHMAVSGWWKDASGVYFDSYIQ